MSDGLLAWTVTHLDDVLEVGLLLGTSIVLVGGTVIAGWPLRTAAGRKAARDVIALEEGNPWKGLIALLVITSLGLVVALCSA